MLAPQFAYASNRSDILKFGYFHVHREIAEPVSRPEELWHCYRCGGMLSDDTSSISLQNTSRFRELHELKSTSLI